MIGGIRFYRTQLPLRYAFAVTTNRSQGGTYDVVGYHAQHPIWAHGMCYTSITRATTANGLTILCRPDLSYYSHRLGTVVYTIRNIVHPRVSHRRSIVESGTGRVRPEQELDPMDEGEVEYGPEFLFYLPRPTHMTRQQQ